MFSKSGWNYGLPTLDEVAELNNEVSNDIFQVSQHNGTTRRRSNPDDHNGMYTEDSYHHRGGGRGKPPPLSSNLIRLEKNMARCRDSVVAIVDEVFANDDAAAAEKKYANMSRSVPVTPTKVGDQPQARSSLATMELAPTVGGKGRQGPSYQGEGAQRCHSPIRTSSPASASSTGYSSTSSSGSNSPVKALLISVPKMLSRGASSPSNEICQLQRSPTGARDSRHRRKNSGTANAHHAPAPGGADPPPPTFSFDNTIQAIMKSAVANYKCVPEPVQPVQTLQHKYSATSSQSSVVAPSAAAREVDTLSTCSSSSGGSTGSTGGAHHQYWAPGGHKPVVRSHSDVLLVESGHRKQQAMVASIHRGMPPKAASLAMPDAGGSSWDSTRSLSLKRQDAHPDQGSPLTPPSANKSNSYPYGLNAATAANSVAAMPMQQPSLESVDEDRRASRSNSSGLVRLARRLSQRGERRDSGVERSQRQRSVSIDCGDVRKTQSMEDLAAANKAAAETAPPPAAATAAATAGNSSIPPSPSTSQKLYRKLSGKKRDRDRERDSVSSSSSSSWGGGEGEGSRVEREKSRKGSKGIADIKALFEAVEHQDLDATRALLASNGLDLNSLNADDFTVLDIAVMTNNTEMAKMLLSVGARENSRLLLKDSRAARLNTLIEEADKMVAELSTVVSNGGAGNSAITTSTLKENEKQRQDWEWRYRLLKRMKAGFENARLPECPRSVNLLTCSSSSLLVSFEEPINTNGAVITRYKIEWGFDANFEQTAGEHILYDLRDLFFCIQGLQQGTKYYVRVSSFNMKGFGPAQTSSPLFAVPSSWRDAEGCKARGATKQSQINQLFHLVQNSRPTDSVEMRSNMSPRSSPSQMRKGMKKSIKNLFQSAPRFQKTLKRGAYLAAVLYNEDKVVLTTEDNLPVVEINDNYSNSIHQDLLWFMKVATTWEDIDLLRADMDSHTSSSTINFRSRLLQAAALLQSVLGVQDLGQPFYQPTKDSEGALVITTIAYVKDPKAISSTYVKWVPLSRVHRKRSSAADAPAAVELVLSTLQDKMLYHQVASIGLPPGLYLGYLKLRSSMVDMIRVVVPAKAPNTLPHLRVRDNPNVSREEWEWLRGVATTDPEEGGGGPAPPTLAQLEFQDLLATSTRHLLNKLGISGPEAKGHRICDLEVVEVSEEVSFLLLYPTASNVCSAPGQTDEVMTSSDYISLPLPVFELVHMNTYQSEFIRCYCRLSSILEMDTCLSQHQMRGAFSTDELTQAKQKQQQANEFQQVLDSLWKEVRWIMDVSHYARAKNMAGGLPVSHLLNFRDPTPTHTPPSNSPYSSPLPQKRNKESIPEELQQPCDASVPTTTTSACTQDPPHLMAVADRAASPHSSQATPAQLRQQLLTAERCLLPDSPPPTSPSPSSRRRVTSDPTASVPPGVLKIYPAYRCGFSQSTGVKLQVTLKTTSREIVNMVVHHLNKAAEIKGQGGKGQGGGGPIYGQGALADFGLVIINNSKERVLPDNYCPLQLQNPWVKGKLYVKLKATVADNAAKDAAGI